MDNQQVIEYARNAFTKWLADRFGYPVFVEGVKQNLPEQSFVVTVLSPTAQRIAYRVIRMNSFVDIAYIVRDDSNEQVLEDMFARMSSIIMTELGTVSYADSNGVIRLRVISWQAAKADNVLHLTGSFELNVVEEEV